MIAGKWFAFWNVGNGGKGFNLQKIYDRFLILLLVTMLFVGPVFFVIFFFPQFNQRVVRALAQMLGLA